MVVAQVSKDKNSDVILLFVAREDRHHQPTNGRHNDYMYELNAVKVGHEK